MAALCQFLGEEMEISAWDGEVPRTDNNGDPITPDSAVVPSGWPVIKGVIVEPGFRRATNVGCAPYDEEGQVALSLWATSKVQAQALMDQVDELLAFMPNWAVASEYLGGDPTNPYYFVEISLREWWLGDSKGERTAKSELLFRADMLYFIRVHGAVRVSL